MFTETDRDSNGFGSSSKYINKKIATNLKILSCNHFETDFPESFQDTIVQENF